MFTNMFWGGAVVSIVLASWFFYRFVAPKGWRQWTRVGIVQAFVIAFYAEMYGFPVTLYLLARIFGLDIRGNFWDGNLWIYLTGTPDAMLVFDGHRLHDLLFRSHAGDRRLAWSLSGS